MASIASIRAGLAANLGAIDGLQVSAYALANPTPPCVEIVPASVDYDQALQRGMDTVRMTVRVFVGMAQDIGAQKQLDQFLDGSGSVSIKTVIESDPTLAGAVSDLRVVTTSGYRVYGDSGRLLGAEWDVEIIT